MGCGLWAVVWEIETLSINSLGLTRPSLALYLLSIPRSTPSLSLHPSLSYAFQCIEGSPACPPNRLSSQDGRALGLVTGLECPDAPTSEAGHPRRHYGEMKPLNIEYLTLVHQVTSDSIKPPPATTKQFKSRNGRPTSLEPLVLHKSRDRRTTRTR